MMMLVIMMMILIMMMLRVMLMMTPMIPDSVENVRADVCGVAASDAVDDEGEDDADDADAE